MAVQQITVEVAEPKVLAVAVEPDGTVTVTVDDQKVFARPGVSVEVRLRPQKPTAFWPGLPAETGGGGLSGITSYRRGGRARPHED